MPQVYRIFAASNVKKGGFEPPRMSSGFLTTYPSQRRPPGRRGASGGFAKSSRDFALSAEFDATV